MNIGFLKEKWLWLNCYCSLSIYASTDAWPVLEWFVFNKGYFVGQEVGFVPLGMHIPYAMSLWFLRWEIYAPWILWIDTIWDTTNCIHHETALISIAHFSVTYFYKAKKNEWFFPFSIWCVFVSWTAAVYRESTKILCRVCTNCSSPRGLPEYKCEVSKHLCLVWIFCTIHRIFILRNLANCQTIKYLFRSEEHPLYQLSLICVFKSSFVDIEFIAGYKICKLHLTAGYKIDFLPCTTTFLTYTVNQKNI